MTLEELKELKPTMDNPVELVCDDGYYVDSYKRIKVQGANNTYLLIETGFDAHTYLHESQLKHYPSKKQKTRYYEWYLKSPTGNWYRHDCLISDEGKLTDGLESSTFKNAIDRKRIDDCFIEL